MDASTRSQVAAALARSDLNAVPLEPHQFERIRVIAQRRFGLSIPSQKLTMANNRLVKLQRRLQFADLEALVLHFEGPASAEDFLQLFDCLSTNLTMFFREADHYDVVVDQLLAPIRELPAQARPKLRFWSAGCSRGCEPYSLAMILRDQLGDLSAWDARILATDFAITELQQARSGVFPVRFVEDLDPELVDRHFHKEVQGTETIVRVNPEIMAPVTFGLLNLMAPWKMRGPFDAIFCRNVMIYFSEETRHQLVLRFEKLLRPGGFLFLGSSEGLPGEHDDLQRVFPSASRKK